MLYVAMTRAKRDLHLVAPLRFYVTQQSRWGDKHVYGARSRFLTEPVLAAFESRVWPTRARAADRAAGQQQRAHRCSGTSARHVGRLSGGSRFMQCATSGTRGARRARAPSCVADSSNSSRRDATTRSSSSSRRTATACSSTTSWSCAKTGRVDVRRCKLVCIQTTVAVPVGHAVVRHSGLLRFAFADVAVVVRVRGAERGLVLRHSRRRRVRRRTRRRTRIGGERERSC